MRLAASSDSDAYPSRESRLASLGRFAAREQDLSKLLQHAVATAAAGLDLDRCAIVKKSNGRDSLEIVTSVGWHAKSIQRKSIPAGVKSQEGYTLSTRNPVVSLDLARETRFRPAPLILSQGLVSSLSVVVEGETGPFGVLVGHSRSERAFSQVHVGFMESIAHVVSESLRRLHADRDRARLTVITELAKDALIATTPDGRIFSWNRAAEEIYGLPKTEAVGQQVTILFPHGRAPEFSGKHDFNGARVGPYTTVGQRQDGVSIDVDISMAPIQVGGRTTGESLVVRNVTERLRSERILRTHTGILDQLQIGVVIWRLDDLDDAASLRLTLANPAGAEAAGLSLDSAAGRRFVDVYSNPAQSEYLARYAEVARTGCNHDFGDCTIPDARSAGDPKTRGRVFRIHAFPLPDQSVGVAFHNVTAERQLADQLHQAQRLEVIGRLVGGVAHDFNNWLTVINGYAEMLDHNIGCNSAVHNDLVQIRQAANSASVLTRQLLTFSRRENARPTFVDLPTVVGSMHGMIRRLIGEDVQLIVSHGVGEAIVRAPMAHIEQVVLNLAANARDAMPRGGRLVIETDVVGLTVRHARRLGETAAGSFAVLTVADTGIGMDQSTRDRIFEPFFTTKETGKGTGLGLSTVNNIVKQNAGHIEVESEPGQGCTFRVYLPLVYHPAAEIAAPQGPRDSPCGSETILVVEDEEAVRALLGDLLSKAGYTVLSAASPSEAVAIAGQHRGAIELLLTDIVMPERTGHDLADVLLATAPRLRVLYTSGYTRDLLARRGVGGIREPFIAKPFAPHDLWVAVRKALDGARATGPVHAAPIILQ